MAVGCDGKTPRNSQSRAALGIITPCTDGEKSLRISVTCSLSLSKRVFSFTYL